MKQPRKSASKTSSGKIGLKASSRKPSAKSKAFSAASVARVAMRLSANHNEIFL